MEKSEATITAMVLKGIEHGRYNIGRDDSRECYVFDMRAARLEALRLCHEAGLDGPESVRTVDRQLESYIDRELRARSARKELLRAS
jgi:hypothetical protein